MVYRIKPLVWVEDQFPNGKHIDVRRRLRCESAVGVLVLTLEYMAPSDRWMFHHFGHMPRALPKGTSEHTAKAIVNDYYLNFLLPALEPA